MGGVTGFPCAMLHQMFKKTVGKNNEKLECLSFNLKFALEFNYFQLFSCL